ncbi:two-component system response regulator YesN [Paenibacillus taihuensis]|uniref:Two-component system response regulator YesN n=1 Tax=Paenibacillus taihuensis TaxID=1156355 RepID=A0A3D9S3U8_9BACL|nr:response regulator [Paenibacillus taihuensis]REE87458.1 two-component system response regulator YesN [Paenibacillus taihuensis]
MIRALIVDDEKLARKGFISIVPWEQFQIQVTGEAANGKLALEFMQQHKVDLLFVDLTMPVMNGIELMKEVKRTSPSTKMVVLTCHQDFDYIQEALRLGALDYIVKTQLDTEKIDDILVRIVERFQNEDSSLHRSEKVATRQHYHYSLLIDVAAAYTNEPRAFPEELTRSELVFDAGNGKWLFCKDHHEPDRTIQQFITGRDHWIWVDIEDSHEQSVHATIARVADPAALKQIYYSHKSGQKMGMISLTNTASAHSHLETGEWMQLLARWSDMGWIYDDASFRELLSMIEYLQPDHHATMQLNEEKLVHWLSWLSEAGYDELASRMHTCYFWHQLAAWLAHFREAVHKHTGTVPYSTDIILMIMKSVQLIHESDNYDFNRDELAAKLLMSGSYFSRCFKDIIGQSYSEYTKNLRLKKALTLVESSELPIYMIAEKTGFQDEKYFSRVFFKQFGKNPQEHRKQHGRRSGWTR